MFFAPVVCAILVLQTSFLRKDGCLLCFGCLLSSMCDIWNVCLYSFDSHIFTVMFACTAKIELVL